MVYPAFLNHPCALSHVIQAVAASSAWIGSSSNHNRWPWRRRYSLTERIRCKCVCDHKDWSRTCTEGFFDRGEIRRVWGKKKHKTSCGGQTSMGSLQVWAKHTSSFNKINQSLIMVDLAVVKHQNWASFRKRIHVGKLCNRANPRSWNATKNLQHLQ